MKLKTEIELTTLFNNCTTFSSDISVWDVTNTTSFSSMFSTHNSNDFVTNLNNIIESIEESKLVD